MTLRRHSKFDRGPMNGHGVLWKISRRLRGERDWLWALACQRFCWRSTGSGGRHRHDGGWDIGSLLHRSGHRHRDDRQRSRRRDLYLQALPWTDAIRDDNLDAGAVGASHHHRLPRAHAFWDHHRQRAGSSHERTGSRSRLSLRLRGRSRVGLRRCRCRSVYGRAQPDAGRILLGRRAVLLQRTVQQPRLLWQRCAEGGQ